MKLIVDKIDFLERLSTRVDKSIDKSINFANRCRLFHRSHKIRFYVSLRSKFHIRNYSICLCNEILSNY